MTIISVKPRNRKEKSLIKTFFKALNLEINESEENEITNPELLKRIDLLENNYKKENYKVIKSENLWETILSK
jgi:ribosomal protein S20